MEYELRWGDKYEKEEEVYAMLSAMEAILDRLEEEQNGNRTTK